MGKLDNTPQPVREAIAVALMVASVTATAAFLLQQPLFIVGGFVLFLIFYIWRINPQIKQAYAEEEQLNAKYADDATYEPILERFNQTHNDEMLVEEYRVWSRGPHANEVKLRFLQEAILATIGARKIYHVEDLMTEMEKAAKEEGLEDRFVTFRSECDRRIAEIAQQNISSESADQQDEAADQK